MKSQQINNYFIKITNLFIVLMSISLLFGGFRKLPYVIYMGSNSQMKVVWQSYSTPTNSTIEWGTTTGYADGNRAVTESGTNIDEHQFSYIISNIIPRQKIYYRVTLDNETNNSYFRAAPPNDTNAVTIYAFGDTRTRPDSVNDVTTAVLSNMGVDPINRETVILHSGDWVEDGTQESEWDDQFFNTNYLNTMKLLAQIPVMGIRGNHEGYGDKQLLKKYFPYDYVSADLDDCYYSFEYGPALLIGIDQYAPYTTGSIQYDWIVATLSNSTKPWKIAVFHEPGWSGGGHANNSAVQDYLQPLFKQFGVQIVVNGHNHYYTRCVVDGIQHLTLGGGGVYTSTPKESMPYVEMAEKTLHFARFDITATNIFVSIIREDNSLVESFFIDDLTRPVNLKAESVGTNAIDLSWTDLTNTIGYIIYTNSTDVFDTNVAVVVSGGTTNYSFAGLDSDVTYYFWMKATNSTEISRVSYYASALSACVPLAPSNVTVTASSSSAIVINWLDGMYAIDYHLYKNISNDFSSATYLTKGNSTTNMFVDSGLLSDTTYYYWVVSSNVLGSSAESIVTFATTYTVTNTNTNTVNVTPAEGIYLFPNPAKEGDIIRFNDFGYSTPLDVEVSTVNGSIVWRGDTSKVWDLKNIYGKLLKPGIYFYMVVYPDGNKYRSKLLVVE